MRTTFLIHYDTGPSGRVLIDLDGAPMSMVGGDDGWWSTTIEIRNGAPYRYLVATEGDHEVEHTPMRSTPSATTGEAVVIDRWRAPHPERSLRQSAMFTNVVAHRHPDATTGNVSRAPHGTTFRLLEPNIPAGMVPGVVGSAEALGGWDPDLAVPMTPAPFPWWQVHVQIGTGATEYKYVLLDEAGAVVGWEPDPNRTLPLRPEGATFVSDDELRGVTRWRGAGVAIPVFALRTTDSVGVGQFTDLIPLVDWAADVGMSVVQILPVNDTISTHDWDDSYPYDVVSVRALHPIYMDLDALAAVTPTRADGVASAIGDLRRACDRLPEVDYETVMDLKETIIRDVYGVVRANLDDDLDFTAFVTREWDWLAPYSAWCHLRDLHGTPDHHEWGPDAEYDVDRITAMAEPASPSYDVLRYHWFVQFHLHHQLDGVTARARSRGVGLKGDLPIGVSPHSAEVWVAPQYFHVGAQAGAPPDAFAVRGQNWGFPTYDWVAMAKDGYRWWRTRFQAMARHVDVYRIDHILGFFRIWEVPPDAIDGLLGRFRPCIPLSADEILAALGPIDIDRLTRPWIDADLVGGVFGANAPVVMDRFLDGSPSDLQFVEAAGSQRAIAAMIDEGALSGIPSGDVASVRRTLLDLAAGIVMAEVDGGYHPRISWRDTEIYRRMDERQRTGLDALAEHFFHHRHAEMWERQGRMTIPAVVDATDMLACGEDLGMVPAHVPVVMNDLGLLALEIERMPKHLGAWIADPAMAPYLSVVSPSTHDSSPLREWWTEDPAMTARYWRDALGRDGDAPAEATPEIIASIIERHMFSPAMLSIAPLSDYLAMDAGLRRDDGRTERINEPADRHHHWRYRMHLDVTELAGATAFNDRLRRLIASAGR